MILDSLAHAWRYSQMHPRFNLAFSWCQQDLAAVAAGRHELDGERVSVSVEDGMTCPAASKRFESHRRFIDIHVPLSGPESMEWAPSAGLDVNEDFQEGGDIRFHDQPAGSITRLIVPKGYFAIFFPEDAHKPGCDLDATCRAYRKLVFKIER